MTDHEMKKNHDVNGQRVCYTRYISRVLMSVRRKLTFLPEPVKNFARRFLLRRQDYLKLLWESQDPFVNDPDVSSYPAKVPFTLGIIKEFRHLHRYYIAACRELSVPYKLVDISGTDWMDRVRDSQCDAFLVRPPAFISIWKQMFDERLKVVVEDLGKIIYPNYDEIWFYESKRRMNYWLKANDFPHPVTWIFYDFDDAMRFAETAQLPIVYKADFGSASSGVKIFRNRKALKKWIARCFKKKVVRNVSDNRDCEWGSIVLQEYIPDILEWRMIRIGDSYFGHQKLRKGDFHSGSGKAGWDDPPTELLDLTKRITDCGNFRSMALDIFVAPDGQYLINELQTVFGFAASAKSQMIVEGKSGRYIWDSKKLRWIFQEGDFSSDGCYKLRVETIVKMLQKNCDEL